MTPMQARFVEEYLIDLNAYAALKRAGYSEHTAKHQGYRIVHLPAVAQAIKAAMERRAAKMELTQRRVLQELKALAFSDIGNYQADASGHVKLAPGAPPDAMRAVSSIKRKPGSFGVEVEIRLWDKPGTLKLAGKHLGVRGFADRLELTGPQGGAIETVHFYIPKSGRERKG
jgi:phage terminase small subunit